MKYAAFFISAALLAACGASDKDAPATTGATAPVTAPLPSVPGFTAAAHAKDIITARQDLMTQIEQLMIPIDGLQVGDKAEAKTLREHADVIAAMLTATPHLFPPNTNLYDPAAEQPATLAMPAIWQSFDGFYSLATAAAAAARDFGMAEGKDAQRKAGLALRAACDACHAGYLRPYKPSAVQESDKNFDAGALLN
jgi:cytochrome c556